MTKGGKSLLPLCISLFLEPNLISWPLKQKKKKREREREKGNSKCLILLHGLGYYHIEENEEHRRVNSSVRHYGKLFTAETPKRLNMKGEITEKN